MGSARLAALSLLVGSMAADMPSVPSSTSRMPTGDEPKRGKRAPRTGTPPKLAKETRQARRLKKRAESDA